MKKIILTIIFLILTFPVRAEYSNQEICDAIFIIEGGNKTNFPYGIKSVKCEGKDQCEKICLNTVRNNRLRFANQTKEAEFLKFFQNRYCPNSEPMCESWLPNLKYYLEKK
jgi:hypothetical protein